MTYILTMMQPEVAERVRTRYLAREVLADLRELEANEIDERGVRQRVAELIAGDETERLLLMKGRGELTKQDLRRWQGRLMLEQEDPDFEKVANKLWDNKEDEIWDSV